MRTIASAAGLLAAVVAVTLAFSHGAVVYVMAPARAATAAHMLASVHATAALHAAARVHAAPARVHAAPARASRLLVTIPWALRAQLHRLVAMAFPLAMIGRGRGRGPVRSVKRVIRPPAMLPSPQTCQVGVPNCAIRPCVRFVSGASIAPSTAVVLLQVRAVTVPRAPAPAGGPSAAAGGCRRASVRALPVSLSG